MRKFFITLLVLIIISTVAFVFGWVQFSVPPGKYGVVSSKTHGIDPVPVVSGEFRWIWYKLIPTNVNINVFSLDQKRYPIDFNSTLPSGNTYASFTGLTNVDFTWNLQGEMSFSLNPNHLVHTVTLNNISNQEELDAYLKGLFVNIEGIVLKQMSSLETDTTRLENLMLEGTDLQFVQEISLKFPEITDFTLHINSAKFPDFVLYRQIRQLYEEFLASQRNFVSSSFGRMAENHILTQLRFEELERYGDMLTKYPILLDYLRMEHNKDE